MYEKDERIISVLRKLLALSERGIDGEKKVAKQKLTALLKKHNLNVSDLLDSERHHCAFKYHNEAEKSVLLHCYNRIRPSNNGTISYGQGSRTKTVYFELTRIEEADLRAMWAHHRKHLRKEYRRIIQNLADAYIQANDLAAPPTGKETDLTSEERERLLEVLALASSIESKPWLKPCSLLEV